MWRKWRNMSLIKQNVQIIERKYEKSREKCNQQKGKRTQKKLNSSFLYGFFACFFGRLKETERFKHV